MRRIVGAAACAALFVACSTGPANVVEETADNLGDIRSGEMSLDVLATTATGSDRFGFTVEGPFSLPEDEDSLPVLDLEYTQTVGDQELTSSFISTGDAMYIETDEGTFELPDEQTETFRTGAASDDESILSELELGDWLADPELEEGDETETVVAELDVVNALNDLFGLARDLGAAVPEPLEGDSAEQVENAVDSSSFEMVTGKDDRYLRLLSISIDLEAEAEQELQAISDLLGVRFEMELTIERHNEQISVEAPEGAEPLP